MPSAAAMTANRNSMSMISISEMMNPAIASPRGLLNMPMNENMSPRIHIIHPKTGNPSENKSDQRQYESGCSQSVCTPLNVYGAAVIVVVDFHGFLFSCKVT